MNLPIFDLHCDLLGCVEHNPEKWNFFSPEINCSLPQLQEGGVRSQVMALFTMTQRGSSRSFERQLALYQELQPLLRSNSIRGILGVENASGLLEEKEPLDLAFSRMEKTLKLDRVLYVSLTWNQENRFGGGNASTVGLKEDGKELLRYLHGKNIAIDFSHTSDQLAHDLFNLLDREKLDVLPIASHSNFRVIKDIPRNLPDELAREIITRGGVIGINFVRRFVGDEPEDFLRHIEHGLKLGGEDALALGADFYGGIEIPKHLLPNMEMPVFQPGFDNASCYPAFLNLLRKNFPEGLVEKIAHNPRIAKKCPG